jgi:hypothetical protein
MRMIVEVVRMTSRRVMVAVERMTTVEDKRGPGRPKGYKHSEETKAKIAAKMTVYKRQAKPLPRSTVSGQFLKVGFLE